MSNWTAVRLGEDELTHIYIGNRIIGHVGRDGDNFFIIHDTWDDELVLPVDIDFDQACEELVIEDEWIEENNKKIFKAKVRFVIWIVIFIAIMLVVIL